MGRREADAEIQRVVRHISHPSQEATLHQMSAKWSGADFLYAMERLETDQPSGTSRAQLREIYRTLKLDRDASDARAKAEEASADRHTELAKAVESLKQPHWTVLPNFWLTVISAAAAIVAAIIGWLALKK